jgi:ATP-dependent protease ClpP protease subunit
MNIDDMVNIGGPIGAFTNKPTGFVHEFYLIGSIDSAEKYMEWFDIIRHATEADTVKIYINSYGGDMFSAIQFMRVLDDTRAHVVISVEGACMSAATIIMLCGHSYEISSHSAFMFHNYSGGALGKGGEMYDQIEFERKWSSAIWIDIYEGFLSTTEIDEMLNGKDIWLTSEEVTSRLEEKMLAAQKLLDSTDEVTEGDDNEK